MYFLNMYLFYVDLGE